jgi:hypothetical protein
LEAFYEQNPGFAQFADRHGAVAAAPEVRKAFRRWEYDRIIDALEEERRAAKAASDLARGIAKANAEGRAEGKAEAQMEIALMHIKAKGGKPSRTMLNSELLSFGIPDSIVKAALKKYEEEQRPIKQDRGRSEPSK